MNGEISIQNGENGENYLWSLFFKKKVQNTSEKNWMDKILCRYFFLKVQTTSERKLNGEISIQNGDFSDVEWRKLFVEFVFQKKSKRFWKKIMETIPCRCFFQKKNQKRFWKTFEWRNLHSEWRFLNFKWRKKKYVAIFFQKKIQNASEKNWMEKSPFRMEKSAFIFLRSVFHLQFHILQKKMVKTLFNKSEWRFLHSEWRFLHSEWSKVSGTQFADNFQKKSWKRVWKIWTEKSPFTFFLRSVSHQFFQKKKRFLLHK